MPLSFDYLCESARLAGIEILVRTLRGRNKGLYGDDIILLDSRIPTSIEKACVLAEELGHYYTSSGNILDQSDLRNRKQELRARQWAFQCMLPLNQIVQAHYAHVAGRYELADYLGVTEDFLQAAINRYTEKYGLSVMADDWHTIYFDPLEVKVIS